MKKILLLLLLITSVSYGQTTLANKLKITGNLTDNIATKVNVQATDGTVNIIAKSDLIEVLEFSTASAMPVTGTSGKIYVTIDSGRLYRWTGTVYNELLPNKENISNKSDSFTASSSITYVSSKALVNGLALKANIDSPNLTGVPNSPTAIAGTNTTQIANTAFVQAQSAIIPINEGNGIGLVRAGRDATNFGNVGEDALDLSFSSGASTVRGSTGTSSFSIGYDIVSAGYASFNVGAFSSISSAGNYGFSSGMFNIINSSNGSVFGSYNTIPSTILGYTGVFGNGNISNGSGSFTAGIALLNKSFSTTVVGQANLDYTDTSVSPNSATAPLFVVGNGNINTPVGQWTATSRSNALEVLKNGTITAPSNTNTLINTAGAKSLITKEYLDSAIAASPSGTVTSVTNTDLTNTITGTASNPIVSRTAISGDVVIPTASNVATASASIVKSVVLNAPNVIFSNPINFTTATNTATGTLALNMQLANTFLAGATSGAASTPTFRAIVVSDVPTLNQSTTGNATTATNLTELTTTVATLNNQSGINTGDNATNTQYSGLQSNATHTGDATGANVLTLATVNATPATYGSSSSTNTTVVNAKGLVTSIVSNPISITQSQVTNLVSDLAGKQATISGTANVIPKFGTGGVLASQIFDNGTNVGIGTTTPTQKLDVNGNILIPNANSLMFKSTANIDTELLKFTGNLFTCGNVFDAVYKGAGNRIYFTGTDEMRFQNANGSLTHMMLKGANLLIGSTTNNGVDKLQVNGTASALPATTANQVVVKSQLDLKSNDNAVIHNSGTETRAGILNIVNNGTLSDGTDANRIDITQNGVLSALNVTVNSNRNGQLTTTTGSGTGHFLNNASSTSGVSLFGFSSGSGKSIVLNNATAATGVPFTIQKNTVDVLTIQDNGIINATAGVTANQVVVKSQLDLKANLAGTQTFTGIHNFPTATAGNNTTQVATTAFAQGIRPYKVYTALLSQTGTSEPVANVLENTLGGLVVWTRSASGVYAGTLNAAFTLDKTALFITNRLAADLLRTYRGDANIIYVESNNGDGNLLNNTIEIRVYN